jgi:hypothetical protein
MNRYIWLMSDKRFYYFLRRYRFLIFLLFGVALFAATYSYTGRATQIEGRKCPLNEPALVRIGSHIFSIHPNLQGAYVAGNGELIANIKNILTSRVCKKPGTEFIDANQLSIHTPPENRRGPADPKFTALVIINSPPAGAKDLTVASFLKREQVGAWVLSGQKMMGTGAMANSTFYESANHRTANNDPVAFGCYSGRSGRRKCYTWLALSNDVQLEISFSEKDYPQDQWITLRTDVLSFVKSISVSANTVSQTQQ